ncbi:transglutaminase family protein [Pseudosulfitobacter koreensis]|uniref:Transglutaminase family protein n=1 Tax=Pseudosulfitobacter koreensis TaxID=2968472 RepID=A0ABT1Z2Y0_9RHOB|nr:transglutaminase family protein [Pseudosulfitobacter koreense]MCR8827502.1 transglutaminase family protein [Pseudosulfitobacter koreense]
MEYDIRLTLSHTYHSPAGNGRHVVRVVPRALGGRQRLKLSMLTITPSPSEQFDSVDFFGNQTTTFVHADVHSEMAITMACRIDVQAPAPLLDFPLTAEQLAVELADVREMGPLSPTHFLGPSPRLVANSEISAFARAIRRDGDSVADTVMRLGEALHGIMTFDAMATTVDTNAVDAFRLKRGVCQDYSHVMILALRALGIPAGYVSGYLRTLPPKGGTRLEGADAMHAWVKAWCGAALGWVEYDPTNRCIVGTDHIVVGYGRDYADVSPDIGHLRSAGNQTTSQSVDVKVVT